jgi:hypothetical protein
MSGTRAHKTPSGRGQGHPCPSEVAATQGITESRRLHSRRCPRRDRPRPSSWVAASRCERGCFDELSGLRAPACSASATWSRRCSVAASLSSAATASTRSASPLWHLGRPRSSPRRWSGWCRGRSLVLLQRVPDEPEHRRPEADEERAALGVPAFLLVDGLGADPQRDAQADARERRGVRVPASQPCVMKRVCQHGRRLPAGSTRVCRADPRCRAVFARRRAGRGAWR